MFLFSLEGIEPEGLGLVLRASTADLHGSTATNIDNGFGAGYAAPVINRGPKGSRAGRDIAQSPFRKTSTLPSRGGGLSAVKWLYQRFNLGDGREEAGIGSGFVSL
jgi:hypothetical protein